MDDPGTDTPIADLIESRGEPIQELILVPERTVSTGSNVVLLDCILHWHEGLDGHTVEFLFREGSGPTLPFDISPPGIVQIEGCTLYEDEFL